MEQKGKEYHNTFWQHRNIEITHPYYVLFSAWDKTIRSLTVNGFDTLDDALEETKLINSIYDTTPKPTKNYVKDGQYQDSKWGDKYNWDFSNGGYFWGYALLDMNECKFINIKNEFHYPYSSIVKLDMKKKHLGTYDYYFRKESEVPKDYEWHHNGAEYKGWLQYRWGDGKNAIDYVEPPKKERPGVTEVHEIYDESIDDYVKKKIRVVYVNWGDPLPKKEKGIVYLRPNKEPVVFPGDFGYNGDYNIQPWALEEEIAEEDYYDKGGFDLKETTQSIADMMGEDNPLMKLKRQLENA